MISDPIADMLVRMKNANQRRHPQVKMDSSKVKIKIADIMKKEGFITDYRVKKIDNVKSELIILLKYKGTTRVISGLKRMSKPGLRVYSESSKLPQVLNGFGIAIISTPEGIMTDKKARAASLGGEVIAYVW